MFNIGNNCSQYTLFEEDDPKTKPQKREMLKIHVYLEGEPLGYSPLVLGGSIPWLQSFCIPRGLPPGYSPPVSGGEVEGVSLGTGLGVPPGQDPGRTWPNRTWTVPGSRWIDT